MSCCTDERPHRMTMDKDQHFKEELIGMVREKCKKNCEKCKEKQETKRSSALKKTFLLPLILFASAFTAMAQDAAPATKTFWDDPINSPMLPLYVVTTFVFVTIVLVMVVSVYMLKILNMMVQQAREERAALTGKVYVPQPSWWDKLVQKLNASVPVAQEQDIDLGHNFDGIRELDNHLPPWWKWLFVATIIWAAIYIGVYHLSNTLPLSIPEYENELAVAEEQARLYRASQPAAVIDENTLTYTKDDAILANGKIIFTGTCVACHRADGGGNTIGPNLTDEYWIHGGGVKNIFTTVKNGAVEKGMPAWGKAMSPQDVRDVVFYVMSLQGSNPKEGKAPQGDLYKVEEEKSTTDSTNVQTMLNP
jgi:cytochrome c oxidase cbb3-type subunit III